MASRIESLADLAVVDLADSDGVQTPSSGGSGGGARGGPSNYSDYK